MKRSNIIFAVIASWTLSCTLAVSQAPVVNIGPQRHGNLAAAQEAIVQAYARIDEAQQANDDHLGGHAQKAKELLRQANDELRLAADSANSNESQNGSAVPSSVSTQLSAPNSGSASAPARDLSGNWTIYAYNVNQSGSSLKTVQLTQNGNILSGSFRGPHQHGKLQGWVNGSHVEFSTDTREVLTFRGEIVPTGMSGLYGINGQHAAWKAERSN
jgi:hypothetical protein